MNGGGMKGYKNPMTWWWLVRRTYSDTKPASINSFWQWRKRYIEMGNYEVRNILQWIGHFVKLHFRDITWTDGKWVKNEGKRFESVKVVTVPTTSWEQILKQFDFSLLCVFKGPLMLTLNQANHRRMCWEMEARHQNRYLVKVVTLFIMVESWKLKIVSKGQESQLGTGQSWGMGKRRISTKNFPKF